MKARVHGGGEDKSGKGAENTEVDGVASVQGDLEQWEQGLWNLNDI